jgi:hypothetical protein
MGGGVKSKDNGYIHKLRRRGRAQREHMDM